MLLALVAAGCAAPTFPSVPRVANPTEFPEARTFGIEAGTPVDDRLEPHQRAWLDQHVVFGMPRGARFDELALVVREGYALAHDPRNKVARWCAYHLPSRVLDGLERRHNDFLADPELPEHYRAELSDYHGSGYDKGHQCPAGDSKGRGDRVMSESFYLSNMTPQNPALNRGRWRQLEARIRSWARAHGEVWVITGPVIEDEDGDGYSDHAVGLGEVAVPTGYFKVVVIQGRGADPRAIAFLFPNHRVERLEEGLTSVDAIEAATGLDLLWELDDETEARVEAHIETSIPYGPNR